MKNSKKIKVIAGCILLTAALALSIIARKLPGFAQWYAVHLYPVWAGSIGRLTGYIPVSVSEMLLYLLLFAALASVLRIVITWYSSKDTRTEIHIKIKTGLLNLFLLGTVLAFLYVVNCGINYHRSSFSETSGIASGEYTAEELKEVCQWLTWNVQKYGREVERGTNGGMLVDVPLDENAIKAMEGLGKEYPELKGYYPKPKKLVNSWILSIQDLSGVYSPFTIEANYNGDMQDFYIPFTVCHELSHLRGFMQEQEANFIAFLACTSSGEEAFAYSGYLAGWIQCMNVLYRTDYDAWEEIRTQLPEGAETDLKLNRDFWARYDGRIAEVSNKVNDTYLKANGQKDGVKSYNRMVDLIVGYYKK